MRDYIIRRLLLLAPIMIGVSFLTYATFSVIPGDAAILICQFECNDENLPAIRHELGLDRPFYEQYGDWIVGIFQGDLGESFFTHVPVTTELGRRLPVTAELGLVTIILALFMGIPPGVLSAVRPGTLIDWFTRFVSVLWLSIPSFYLAILVITFGLLWLGWTPPQFATGKYVSFFDDPWVNIQQFVPPAIVLSVGIAAVIMRLTRSSMLEVMRNDYIRTAWSKGLRERSVVWRHALKNALIPVTTIIGLQIGALIGGAVLIESVFSLNGVGKYVLEAILRRDLMVVQSLVLIFAATYVLANLTVDLVYAWLDPRIRYG
jgi:peptide/nickel transport system permease protein